VTGGPGGDWDAIEEAIEGLPVARPQVDARHAEVERLRAELSDLYPAIESLRDELIRAKAERDKLRALLDPDNEETVDVVWMAIKAPDNGGSWTSEIAARKVLAALREAAS
jgi:uncharacterized coiled-coil DUF342 family protein